MLGLLKTLASPNKASLAEFEEKRYTRFTSIRDITELDDDTQHTRFQTRPARARPTPKRHAKPRLAGASSDAVARPLIMEAFC